MSNSEKKRIKLTNGVAVIAGLSGITVSLLTWIIYIFLKIDPNLYRFPVLIGFTAGIASLNVVFLSKHQKHLLSRIALLGLWWTFLTLYAVTFGQDIRLDQYLIATLLMPYGLFAKRRHISIAIAVNLILFFFCNVFYRFYPPILPIEEPILTYLFFAHTAVQLILIIALVRYFITQNRISERALSEEINKHISTTEQLRDANDSKDKFFSIIAHDLKGPVGNFATILENYTPKEIPDDLYKHLKDASRNTYNLLQDLLIWARSKKGQIEYFPQDFAISDLLEKVHRVFALSAKDKNIKLTVKQPEKEIYAYADFSTVNTIIRNLISNALKFTPVGGEIKLSYKQIENSVAVYVADNGVGIDAGKLKRLFKIGERNISSPGTNNETGTGIGLLLCKEFAVGNGGDIFVESSGSAGSTFWFTLPIGQKPKLDFEDVEQIDYSKLRALVVEDNYLNMQTTCTELEKIEMVYDIAEDGEKAVEMGVAKKYNIIFMDIDLPKRNGIEANKAIRKVYADARIVALSSFDKAEIREKDADVVFDGYLKKPLDAEELAELLQFVAIKKELGN
jgi:signal transduction histidine kinase/ActR/RegA family two-component response regulator